MSPWPDADLALRVFEASPIAILVTAPDGTIEAANAAFSQLSGYANHETVGRRASLLRSGRHDQAFYRQIWQSLQQQGQWSGELWNRHRSGQIRRHELTINAIRDPDQQIRHYVAMLRDVSERYAEQQQVQHRALHDVLTGLPNRALLMEQLAECLALARRKGGHPAVLYLDIDDFKPVNDRFGHAVGDRLLRQLAKRMAAALRRSDILCREGGDEFVLVVSDGRQEDDLRRLAQLLQGVVAEPWPGLPEPLTITLSIGIARWPDAGASGEALLDAADRAMYAAKQRGGDQIAFAGSSLMGAQPLAQP